MNPDDVLFVAALVWGGFIVFVHWMRRRRRALELQQKLQRRQGRQEWLP
jgi:hypothetical protein